MASPYYTEADLSRALKYKGGVTVDKSLIYKYIVSPFCARLVQYLPSWLAPNLMTLLGFMCNIAAFLLCYFYYPDLMDSNAVADGPRWVYFMFAVLTVAYMLLDNSDGKQSVRTGSSSPLGELLDHGCDSFTIAIMMLMLAATVNAGPLPALVLTGSTMVAFYMSHWQEYFCHYLELPMLTGPTEAQTAVVLLFIFVGFFGSDIFHVSFDVGITLTPVKIVVYLIGILTFYTAAEYIYTGTVLARKNKVDLRQAYSALIPFFMSFLAAIVWSISNIDLFYSHPYVWLTCMNLLFSYLVINCIIQRICDLTYSVFYLPVVPLVLCALNSVFGHLGSAGALIDEELSLYILWSVYFLLGLHFSSSVINGFCNALNIHFLTIPYPNKATKNYVAPSRQSEPLIIPDHPEDSSK